MASNKIVINDGLTFEVPDSKMDAVESVLYAVCTGAHGAENYNVDHGKPSPVTSAKDCDCN
jgi:hypothetical protein